MEKREIERYRRKLQELTTRMRSDAAAVTDQIREGSGGQSGGGLSNAPMHLGDMGTDEYLQDLNATLLEHEEYSQQRSPRSVRPHRQRNVRPLRNLREADRQRTPRRASLCAALHPVCRGGRHGARRPISTRAGPGGRRTPWLPKAKWTKAAAADRATRRIESDAESPLPPGDVHAAGTPGGGTAVGGLAGSNAGHGDPGCGRPAGRDGQRRFGRTRGPSRHRSRAQIGTLWGAVGGTPANKRNRTGRSPRQPERGRIADAAELARIV